MNKKHLEILRQKVEGWNDWRRENPEVEPDLSGANLEGADLYGANLSEAILNGANLAWANLYGANLSGAGWPRTGRLLPGLPRTESF